MSCVLELLRSRSWPRAAVLALMTIGVAGCSGEVSRFDESPYVSRSNPEPTGSIPPAQAAPAGRVESSPLPPQTAQAAPPDPVMSAPASSGVAGGGRGLASYSPTSTPPSVTGPSSSPARPSAALAPDVTGSVAAPKPAPSANWSWDGGTAITVAPGDTVDTIARRYGVPASAIIQSNNLTAPATIRPGQQLVIPRYSNSSVATAPSPAIRPVQSAPSPAHQVLRTSPPRRPARPAIPACT